MITCKVISRQIHNIAAKTANDTDDYLN